MIVLHLMTEATLDKTTIVILQMDPALLRTGADYASLLFLKGAMLLRPSRINFILYF